MVWINYRSGDTQTVQAGKKTLCTLRWWGCKNFTQLLGLVPALELPLTPSLPIVSHIVKLSLPNILFYFENKKTKQFFYRYDSTTGTFTVLPGGDGLYYFSVYFTVYYYEYAFFDIQINGDTICGAYGETDSLTFADYVHTTCSATTYAAEGRIYQWQI